MSGGVFALVAAWRTERDAAIVAEIVLHPSKRCALGACDDAIVHGTEPAAHRTGSAGQSVVISIETVSAGLGAGGRADHSEVATLAGDAESGGIDAALARGIAGETGIVA